MKKNIKKILSLGVASALAVTGFAPSFAAVSHFVSQDATEKAYQYGKTELEESFVDGKIGGEGKLYKDYNNSKTLKALNDTKKGYVDYADVENAYIEAKIGGKSFDIDAYTETDAKPYQMPEKVYDVSVDANGNINSIEKPVNPDAEKLEIVSIKPSSDTKIIIKLSKAVDSASSSNFIVEGMSVVSAQLSADKTEVALSVSGAELEREYTLVAKNLQINGNVQEEISSKFKMPKASELFKIKMSIAGDVEEIKADNNTSVLVTFDLVDANEEKLDVNNVELKLSTTFGTFAENRVTVQNGKATALFNSEVLDSAKDALLSAVVIEASNKNLINIKAEKILRLNPNPDSGSTDEKVGISLTDVATDMADRVILYFNKDVDLSKYIAKDTTNGYDKDKLEITIKTNVSNSDAGVVDDGKGQLVNVIGLKPVQGNSKAVYAILDVDTKEHHLTDNARLNVRVRDLTEGIKTDVTKSAVLTDARRPSLLKVSREDLNKIVVTFSEPVIGYSDISNYPNSAVNSENWILDGVKLSDDKWGKSVKAKVEVEKFDIKTGEDKRHIATITLGKDVNEKQIYIPSGIHSLQGAKIGDYADVTDKGNNIINTQTLDFVVNEDTNMPTATVDVHSPEQYLVTFNMAINESDLNNIIKLQKYNSESNSWEDETKQTINIRKVEKENNKFIVEVKKDWTVIYDTEKTNKNHYNDSYRLAIDEDKITSVVNGNTNEKIEMLLEGAMKSPDIVSPVITDIVEKTKGKEYVVIMSEPVKFEEGGDNYKTPSQGQGGKYETDEGTIPTPTAQFIKIDNSETIEATVIANPDDSYDRELIVMPKNEGVRLTAGEWKLVVASISDDIGNTASSENKNFTVTSDAEVDKDFEVSWAVVDFDGTYDTLPGTDKDTDDLNYDYVFVKFSQNVKMTGGQVSALTTTNYTLNGDPLPKGTQITANIKDFDDRDDLVDSITIKVPKGSISGFDNTVITVSPYIQNADGKTLVNGGQFKLPYNFDSDNVSPSIESASINIDEEILSFSNIEDGDIIEIEVDPTKDTISTTKDLKVVIKENNGVTIETNNAKINEQLIALGLDDFKASQVENGKITIDLTDADLTDAINAIIGDKPLKDFIGKSLEITLKDKANNPVSTISVKLISK